MNRVSTLLCGAASFLAVSATARAEALHDCQQLADKMMAAWNAGDAEGVADAFDPKVGMFSNGFGTAAGRDGLVANFKPEIATGMKITSNTCTKALRIGTMMIAHGTWTATARGPDGKDIAPNGHWMASARYHGRHLVIVTDVVNTQLPASAK
jgi:uncharacterized protein (TIGR02246 family)